MNDDSINDIYQVSNKVVEGFQSLNIFELGGTLSDISLILIGVIITIFVLTVTLLGKAAKVSQERKNDTETSSSKEFDADIQELTVKLKENPRDIEGLKKQIEDLEKKKSYTNNVLRSFDKKYSALGLKESVLVPGILFLTSIILTNWFSLISQNTTLESITFLSALVCVCIGIRRIIKTLQAVQYFAVNIKDEQMEQLQSALIEALKTVDAEKKPKPFITFVEKPPFIFKVNTEAEIEFNLDLSMPGNPEAENIEIWFLLSPEIEILENSAYEKPFRQNSRYIIPNANTIRYKFNKIRKHNKYSGKVKIKPTSIGEFKLRYKVNCDGYTESVSTDKEKGIIVEE